MSAGQQAVQSMHAALDFSVKFPTLAKDWHTISNYLVCLAVKDETELKKLIQKCNDNFLKISVFVEPDINNKITAICIEPSDTTQKLVSNYPLMLKENKEKDIIVFHYNKKHNEDTTVPPWVIKHKGDTHYVNHVVVDNNVAWNTKETPDNPHTKGAIKLRGKLSLEFENNLLIAKIK